MANTNSLRRWRIFQLTLSSIMLFFEISNIILYSSFNPNNIKSEAEWNHEFWALRDKNRLIISIICLPTTIISIFLLAYVLIKGEISTKRNSIVQKIDPFKSIESDIKQFNESNEPNGCLDILIGRNIGSILLFAWSLTVILNSILFHKNWDLMCYRLEEKERSSILCDDFIINLLLNIVMFASCVYLTFVKLLHSSYNDNSVGEIGLKG